MISFWKRFWKGIWRVVKQMGSIRGVIALILVWFVISGSGVSLLGLIFKNGYLIGLGATIYAFWLAPLTPLIPINIAIAMIIQRYVFRDKRVGWSNIKNQFKEAFKKDINERKKKWKYKDLAMKTKKEVIKDDKKREQKSV